MELLRWGVATRFLRDGQSSRRKEISRLSELKCKTIAFKVVVFLIFAVMAVHVRINLLKSKTRGEIEAEISEAIVKFEKEYLGRGPLDARAFFVNDMILVRLRGVLTPAERKIAECREGQLLVKDTRRQLFESCRSMIETIVEEIVNCRVVSMHTDVSTKTGERVIVLTVDINLDEVY